VDTDGLRAKIAQINETVGIAYSKSGAVYYAEWNGSDWETELVDANDESHSYLFSLLYFSNTIYIAFRGNVAHRAANLTWITEIVIPNGLGGDLANIAGILAYTSINVTSQELMYIEHNGSAWNAEVADTTTPFIQFYFESVLRELDGYPLIVYGAGAGLQLTALKTNTSSWTLGNIPNPANRVSHAPSITSVCGNLVVARTSTNTGNTESVCQIMMRINGTWSAQTQLTATHDDFGVFISAVALCSVTSDITEQNLLIAYSNLETTNREIRLGTT